MSELPEGVAPAVPPTPRPSAAGLVLRPAGGGAWLVLAVVRSKTSRFMPGHLAFPGGAVDPIDRPGDPGAFARCVSREVREETGLAIPPGDWIPAGERTTPPMFPVRFHNPFFVVAAPARWEPPDVPPSPDEVERIGFRRPAEMLDAWSAGAALLPPPSLALLRALADAEASTLDEIAAAVRAANDLEERAPRIEFVPDVWMLPVLTATLPPATHTNVWMPGGRQFVVIDPGSTDEVDGRRLREVIERRVALSHRPTAVLLTHGHRDHCAGALRLAADLGLPLRAHADVLAALPADADVPRVPIADGERLDLDGMTLVALATPGHARGHLAFHVPERSAAIAGDLVSGISTILIDPDGGDMGDYLASLALLGDLNCRRLLPGHGPPLPGRAARELLEHRLQRERRVLGGLAASPRALAAIAAGAYAAQPGLPARLVERQALSHLIRLEKLGQARRDDPAGMIWRLAGAMEDER